MLENHGEYICPNPIESYLTNAELAHPSVYRLHFKSDGFEPYTTTNALLRSPKSFLMTNPILSNSTDKISPIDFLIGSSLLIKIVISIGFSLITHLSLIFFAPFSFKIFEIISFASSGLYLKLNNSNCSITERYSGSDVL